MSKTRHVVVVGTGGTIASRYDPALGRTVASQGVEAIVGLAAKPGELPRLTFENFATIAGFNMTLPFIHGLVGRLRELLASSEVDALVVTQGTDTMEETSFLANLLIDTQKPLVFTGAQLAHDHPQSDGPRNVIDAIHAAASEETQGLGAMVCFNGELHAAREVSKFARASTEQNSTRRGRVSCASLYQLVLCTTPTRLFSIQTRKCKALFGQYSSCLSKRTAPTAWFSASTSSAFAFHAGLTVVPGMVSSFGVV